MQWGFGPFEVTADRYRDLLLPALRLLIAEPGLYWCGKLEGRTEDLPVKKEKDADCEA